MWPVCQISVGNADFARRLIAPHSQCFRLRRYLGMEDNMFVCLTEIAQRLKMDLVRATVLRWTFGFNRCYLRQHNRITRRFAVVCCQIPDSLVAFCSQPISLPSIRKKPSTHFSV